MQGGLCARSLSGACYPFAGNVCAMLDKKILFSVPKKRLFILIFFGY